MARVRHKPVCAHAGEVNRRGLCNKCYMAQYYERNRKQLDRYKQEWNLQKFYGLSLEAYEALVLAQRGLCFICKRGSKKLVVDHNHSTGEVRKLLCIGCNFRVGMVEKKAALLAAAKTYLESFGAAKGRQRSVWCKSCGSWDSKSPKELAHD